MKHSGPGYNDDYVPTLGNILRTALEEAGQLEPQIKETTTMTNTNHNFTLLVGRLSANLGRPFVLGEIEALSEYIDQQYKPATTTTYVNDASVNNLLHAIQGQRKIEAIKEYRSLTGIGLKESKDAIEKYWPKDIVGTGQPTYNRF